MNDKFDFIIERLEEYEEEVIKYLSDILEDTSSSIEKMKNDEKSSFYSHALDSLIALTKNEIYQDITNNYEILNKEYFERVNYYYYLNENSEFNDIINKLYEAINSLYSLIDINALLNPKDNNYEKNGNYCLFYNFTNAVNYLNIENKLEIKEYNINDIDFNKSYYNQLINLIKDKNNYYILELNKPCWEGCEERLITNKDILNKYEIIAQYEALKQPIDTIFIKKFIKDVAKFETVRQNYISDIDKLKKLLKGNIETENLNYFYLFNRLISCNDSSKYSDISECFICSNCFFSIIVVLKELRKYINTLNKTISGKSQILLTDKQKEILKLLIEGNNLTDISSQIKRSSSTLKSRLEGIYKKLGTNSIPSTIAKAVELKLI